ncbi:MAG: DUF4286 family protein [Flavobacteriales bacterium]|jgi:hypothetical protein|nr:DUF4286 family protein [Flavobacteriales bacterium]
MKIIYNVTVNIEETVHTEWLQWMKETHIPEVMATGKFIDNRFCKVLSDDPQGITYSIQYLCENHEILEDYMKNDAPKLQRAHNVKYEGKFVAFRTLLKMVE